ncbi:hypothetical protein niasHT_020600 [Heterodera trifolii]|uniref:Non-specific serine/threonine protein kinase n=1 Tax=Heterodera trifolii TaxID=157864 RepID=A0ABD2KFK6_9BILA
MDNKKLTPEQQRAKWRKEYAQRSTGHLFWESEDNTLVEWHNEIAAQRTRSLSARRNKRPESPPKPLKWPCTKCSHKSFESPRALSTHMQRMHSGATHSPVRRPSIRNTIDFTAASPEREEPKAAEPRTELPQERWVDPLPQKLQFQQQVNKFAELKCKYSRANAKVRWYKGRKELFSGGLKYKILIDKQSVTLIINNPDPDDSGKYKCEANGVPTNSFVTVEEPPIKYVFLTPLPNTMDIYRTKQGVLTCKLNSARAPLVWQRNDEKPIDVHDPRYQIEKDAAGCFTLTIRVVEQIDQGMWTASVNKNVISKCQVYVVEDPRDTFVVPEQLRNEQAAIEALRRANAEHELRANDAEHETESSDVDEDEYVVESDDDIPAVETNAVVERNPAPTFVWKKGGQKVPLTGLVRCQTDFDTGKDNAHAASTASSCSSATTSTAGIVVASAAERRSDVNSFRVKTAATSSSTASAARTAIVSAVSDKDSSDQPLSSTAPRREPRRQKSARKDAIELTPLDIQCCSKNLTLPRPKNTERTASGSGRRHVGSTAADRPAQAAAAACAAGEEAPDDRDKVPGEPPVTADGKTKYGAESESREKPRLAKRTKESASAGRSLRVRGQTSGEPVVLNFDQTRAELEWVAAPASNCCINVLTPVRPSQRGKCGRSRANTANAGAALAASCEDRFLKPQIITAQRKWKVRAGKTLSLGIKFVGTPDPSVCWVKAGGAGTLPPELIMEDHIKGNTSIFFTAAKRSESGAYELRLKNNVGETEGHFEVLVQDRPAPPKRPLAVDNVARDSCTLSWQPPEDDGGSEVTNYVVECRDVGSQVWLPVNNVVGTNSTVPNLQEGHEYQFRVCAVNAFGCSDPLNTDSAVLAMDPYDPPGRPEVTDHDNNQISIKWAPSTDTGGSPIAHYDVQRKDAKTQRWIKVNTHPVYDCAYTDERVQPEHGYYYRVVAVNEAGLDKPSDQSELAWAKPKFEAPRFELDDINGKEVRVLAGHANTRQYIPKSARSDSGQCRIVATNEKGTAETRGLISVVDRPDPPEGMITYPATTKHSITLSWRPPKDDGGTELSGYRIEFRGLDKRDWERVPDHVTLPDYTVRNLEKGAQYQFRVFAENMVGISEPLNGEPVTAKDPFGPPGPPSTPEVTAYDSNSVSLKWNLPRDEGGSPVTGYVIERFEKRSGGDWASVKGLGILPLTSCTVPGLAQGESYQFRVRAVNAVGKGLPSGACVECSPFVSPPGAPEKPRVGKITKHTVNLSWIRPLHDGGASIDGYVIEQRKMGDDDWARANIGVPGAKAVRDTRCTVKDLPEKEQFEFRVRAVNKAGEGEPSNLVFTTDQPGRPVFDLSNLKDTTDSSDQQPLSSTARRREPRRQKSARKEATANEEERQDMAVLTKNMAILDLSTPGTPARIVKFPENVTVVEDDLAILKCVVEGNPAPTIVWKKGGRKVPLTDDRVRYQRDGDTGQAMLKIRDTSIAISEQQKRRQRSGAGPKSKAEGRKCQVYVVEEPRDAFVVPLNSQRANENENVTFECEVNDEDIDVEWFHGDAKIKVDGRHFKEERIGCHRRLLITNLLIEDQGQYKCTTKDDKTMAQLTVDPLKKFECEAGKEKRIKVPFEVKGTRRGDPKPILLRNGKPVDLNKMKDHVEVIINGTVAEIVFKDPQKSEAGKWSLKLANTGGVSEEAAFELVVNGKPKTPKRPLDTLDVTSNSCIVPGGVRALKRQSILDRNTACEEEFDELLLLCGQGAAVSWADLEQSTGSFDNWSKIGEGAFGEVFRIDSIAVKVMPFAIKQEQCSTRVNGDYLKTAKFIFNELFITKQLTELSEDSGSDFVTPSFTQLRMRKIVKGYFPKKLLKAWDAFKKAKPELSENERPDIYADEDRHFVIIGLSYGGKDLEAYTIRNGHECYSIFHQLALSLAIAESVLEFEHRDLHAGNILVERCADNEKIRYIYQGKKINVVSNGVRASIIDFSISRLTKKGVPFFVDLSQDAGLFAQNGVSDGGDYQYDVYRMMKTVASENWSSFWPQTNVYWMGYAAKKLFNKNRFIRAKRKETIENLFSNFETKFGSIGDFIDHPEFSSVFAEFTSGK